MKYRTQHSLVMTQSIREFIILFLNVAVCEGVNV